MLWARDPGWSYSEVFNQPKPPKNKHNSADKSVHTVSIRHFVNKGGVDTSDTRILRLFSVVAQKFVADIVVDALKDKQQKLADRNGQIDPNAKLTLTSEDLNNVMQEYGIANKKPPYYTKYCQKYEFFY